jgi:hypothetical protein
MRNRAITTSDLQKENERDMRTNRTDIARVLALGISGAMCLTLVLVVGAASAATFNTWNKQTSGTTQSLRSVAFVGARNGWADVT